MKHTQGELTLDKGYIRDKGGNVIASVPFTLGDEQDRANAKHIVKCWNNYPAVVEALKEFHALEGDKSLCDDMIGFSEDEAYQISRLWFKVKSILAKLEE